MRAFLAGIILLVLTAPVGLVWAQDEQKAPQNQHKRETDAACADLLDGTKWPIRVGNRLYEIVMEDDPIDGERPVLIRTLVDEHGNPQLDAKGRSKISRTPLIVDKLTGALLSTTELVNETLLALIDAARKRPHTTAFVFIDINDLGKVNHFEGKQVDGDLYVRRVGESVRGVCKATEAVGGTCYSPQGDWVFRDGGDEIVLLISNVNDDQLQTILNRIADNLERDAEAQALFERHRADTLKALSDQLAQSYPLAVVQEVQRVMHGEYENFEARKKAYAPVVRKNSVLMELIQQYDTALRLRPTISIGSAMIDADDTYEILQGATSRVASSMKRIYKQSIGLDTQKYGVKIVMGKEKNKKKMTRPAIPPALKSKNR